MQYSFIVRFRGKMSSSLRVSNIMDNLDKKSSNFLHAKRVCDTLTNFICSYDDVISLEHVPYRDLISEDSDGDRTELEFFNSDAYKKVVRDFATRTTKTPFTRYRIHLVTTSSSGSLRSYLLSRLSSMTTCC